jgi:hypothetical protein
MHITLLRGSVLALGGFLGTFAALGLAQPAAAQCASGSSYQSSVFRANTYVSGGCYSASGGATLSQNQLFPGQYQPGESQFSVGYGGPLGTSAYGAGGASIAPGGWSPSVAGAPMNVNQYGNFLNGGSSNIRLGLSDTSTSTGSDYSVLSSGAPTVLPSGGLSTPSVLLPSRFLTFGPGDDSWHPQSFYGPLAPSRPGLGTVADDGSAAWPRDPDAPSGR